MPRTIPILHRLMRTTRTRLGTHPRPQARATREPRCPRGTSPGPRGATPAPYAAPDSVPHAVPHAAPPTIEELEAAGVTWEPLDDDEASGLEITRDNGYVVLRDPSSPGRPPLILDEAEWESALDGDDTYDPEHEWFA